MNNTFYQLALNIGNSAEFYLYGDVTLTDDQRRLFTIMKDRGEELLQDFNPTCEMFPEIIPMEDLESKFAELERYTSK